MGLLSSWWRARRDAGSSRERRASRHAEQLEAELSTLLANTSIGVALVDESKRILRANAAMERFLGYGPGELVGVSLREVSHPDDYAADASSFEQVGAGSLTAYQMEKRYLRRDGTIVVGRLIAALLRELDDGSRCLLGMVEDITEQRRVKEQLDASLAQLAAANYRLKLYLERAPLASIVWGPDQIVREWNPAAERMFGYTAAEAIGRNVYDLTSTPESLAVAARVREQFLAGKPYPEKHVVKNRRKDGTEIYCEWHFTIVTQFSDALNGVIAFGTDVTARIRDEQERRHLESSLRQAQKMQSLGTLAGGIAHDFNNILLAISGNTKLAMEELPPDHNAMRSLEEIGRASARASSIVNQILMFGRREEHYERVPVNLSGMIDEALTLLRATLPARIALRTAIEPELPAVNADPGQLHQIVLNLATNAAHAIGDDAGAVHIGLLQVDIDESLMRKLSLPRSGKYVRMTVRDTGAGMTPEVLERIFEPFFTTKPRGQGTGLGLSVVHGIVRSHEGAIEVASRPGSGSSFHVYLPVASGDAKAPAPGTQEPQRGAGQHILYLDDEESLVFLITRVLERLGYRVTGFTDAEAALAAFRAAPASFDAVVTDLSMPGLSGNDVAKQILAVRPDIPIVMTSGYVRAEDRALALATGVRELVMKPNTVDALGQVLHRLLREAAGNWEEAPSPGPPPLRGGGGVG